MERGVDRYLAVHGSERAANATRAGSKATCADSCFAFATTAAVDGSKDEDGSADRHPEDTGQSVCERCRSEDKKPPP